MKKNHSDNELEWVNMNKKRFFLLFWSNSKSQVGHLSDFILFFNFGHIHPFMFQWLMFVGVIFLVMYKFFGHIHWVILNRSNEYCA